MRVLFAFLFFLVMSNSLTSNIRPVPWLVEDAIEFMGIYFEKNSSAKVLEFGSGASTIWLSDRVKELHSVEHDQAWHSLISRIIYSEKRRSEVFLYRMNIPYNSICDQFFDEYFDFIIVDGRNRKACLSSSIRLLKKGGILMLDNSEREYYHSIFDLMKGWVSQKSIQTHPDSCGFYYEGWETRWWIKP